MTTPPSRPVGSAVAIGAVVSALIEEFPDISASKIRYLEDEGLLFPARTARGSRRYTAADVDRLRRVLRLQRDEFLPLRIIREQLDASAAPAEGDSVPRTRMRTRRSRPLSRSELCERSGLDRQTLAELERYGLVTTHDTEALAVCQIVARLQGFGMEPRHLRAFRVAADREIGLVEQALAPHGDQARRSTGRQSGGDGPQDRQARAELLGLCVDLHTALVRRALDVGPSD